MKSERISKNQVRFTLNRADAIKKMEEIFKNPWLVMN